MKISLPSLPALLSELLPDRKCGVLMASTALACLLYVRKLQVPLKAEQEREDTSLHMRTFVRNSEVVLEMIRESSFSSDVDLSCLSEQLELSLDNSQADTELSFNEDGSIGILTTFSPINTNQLWRLTNISGCDADISIKDLEPFETEEDEISYIWDLDSSLLCLSDLDLEGEKLYRTY